MATAAQLKAQSRYDKTHTQSILFKLNRTSDADILAKLNDVGNRQGYVKKLIRQDIRGDGTILSLDALRYFVQPVARKYHLHYVYLFGSYARGEATAESDVDLMIDSVEITKADTYFSITQEFADALGKKVDLVMEKAVRGDQSRAGKRLLSHYERDRVLLYEDNK